MTQPTERLGDLLLRKGLLTPDQLKIGLKEQARLNKPIGETLVSLGFISNSMLREAISNKQKQQSIDLKTVSSDPKALEKIPRDFASHHKIFPIGWNQSSNVLVLAMSDPNNLFILDQVQFKWGSPIEVEPMFAAEGEIMAAITRCYGFELSIDGILDELEDKDNRTRLSTNDLEGFEHPIVRLVNAILNDGVHKNASDIHFEPEEHFIRVRYRIDGVMKQVRSLHRSFWSAISVRLKVMSGMNIAETRAAQDGRISLTVFGRQIDFRVAAHPTIHGENIVLRILDRQRSVMALDYIGLTPSAIENIELLMARPEGVILITGPTGSGKTSTLYSLLNRINDERVNIMTLEDPVEYPIPLIRQTSLADGTRMDFAGGIRSIMRQDPDVILVGEIRDKETAEMAMRAAMTGHQVYATLHTNNAVGAIPRLMDIGVTPDIMSSNLIGIIAQRLVRRLCPACKEPHVATEKERKMLDAAPDEGEIQLFHPKGCDACGQSGYKGRTVVIETLRITAAIEDLIASRRPTNEILRTAYNGGFVPLTQDARRIARQGLSSLEELGTVVNLTETL